MILSFDVNQQTISRTAVTSIPRKGSREYLYLSFTFSDDWTGLTKTLYVSNETYSDGIIVEKGIPVQVPVYYTQQNSFSITLCGIRGNQFVPTNVITILLEESNDTWEEIAPDPESIPYQQLVAMVQKAIESMHAPYINKETNNWMQWDIAQNMFIDTGVPATGVSDLYGVRFSGMSNPGTRLYSAQGLVANVLTDGKSSLIDPDSFVHPVNSFDTIYPWSARRRCCGYWNNQNEFVVNAYEGEPGYTTDGSNGEIWIEHSLFYYKRIVDEVAGTEEYLISGNPRAGFRPAPIFDRGDEAPLQKAYTAAYQLAFIENVPTSRAGVFPDRKSLNDFMTSLKAVNENYRTGTIAEQYTEMLYMYVEFATRDLQTVMQGAVNLPYVNSYKVESVETEADKYLLITVSGITESTFVPGQTIGIGSSLGGNQYSYNLQVSEIRNTTLVIEGTAHNVPTGSIVYSLPYKNGVCDNLLGLASSGTYANDGKHQCFYRGKESPWGSAPEMLSDVLCNPSGYKIYYLPDTRKYSAGAITADYIELQGTLPNANGYIKSLQVDERYPNIIYPKEIGAASTTGYADYYRKPALVETSVSVGGALNDNTYSGPTSYNCTCIPSIDNIFIRARLSFRKP